MPRKERPRKVYEVVNIHPEYESEEERDRVLGELKRDLILMFYRYELEGKVPKGFVTGTRAV